MTRLEVHKKDLYELRFSPMCKPAGEVANLTQLESHTTRSHVMMLWRIAEGHLDWGSREAELLYESTLDSISEAFDVYHYPISRYMLDARADVWQAGLVPQAVKKAVEELTEKKPAAADDVPKSDSLLVAGEIALVDDQEKYLNLLRAALDKADIQAAVWTVPTGATAYTLGARDVARSLGQAVLEGIRASGAQTVIADGPQTALALSKIYPDLGLLLPESVQVELLTDTFLKTVKGSGKEPDKVFFHDARAAYHLSENPPNHLAIMPGYKESEAAFGDGTIYEAPRQLLEKWGADLVYGVWTRGLAKSCGADDGLWLTHPDLAMGLAAQRLDYARQLGATMLVTDSALCASHFEKIIQEENITVHWLPEILSENQ